MADNRRSSTRHDVDIAASVQLEGQDGAPETCRMKNLSIGGACFELRRLPMGTRVTVRFRIPQHEAEIVTGGIVRWATETDVGVQFDGLRAKETWALGKLLESLSAS